MIAKAASAGRGFVSSAFDQIGEAIEAVPGWRRFERFMDEIADGFIFGISLLWALRWPFTVCAVIAIIASR